MPSIRTFARGTNRHRRVQRWPSLFGLERPTQPNTRLSSGTFAVGERSTGEECAWAMMSGLLSVIRIATAPLDRPASCISGSRCNPTPTLQLRSSTFFTSQHFEVVGLDYPFQSYIQYHSSGSFLFLLPARPKEIPLPWRHERRSSSRYDLRTSSVPPSMSILDHPHIDE